MIKLRSLALASTLVALALTSACAYYNTMYNANRLFAEAEKAAVRGDLTAARTAYQQSLEKAATSLARHPRSRWSDDAQLLMARVHLQLGDPVAAQFRLRELLEQGADIHRRAAADLYLGVTAAELGDDRTALERLNAALAPGRTAAKMQGAGLLARARIHYRASEWVAARADTRAARETGNAPARVAALFLDLRIALAAHDTALAREAWRVLLHEPDAQRWTDSLQTFSRLSAAGFSSGFAQSVLTRASEAPWRAGARDSLLLLRAELVLQSGDLAAALRSVEQVAARTTGALADAARVRAAEWRLAHSANLEELAPIRNDLLPAIADGRARSLLQALKTIDVLTERARVTSQPLVLFAAAELARDELHAPALATRLFLTYSETAPQSAWTPKALLAASALDPARATELRTRMEAYTDNPYVAVLQGREAADAYQAAEERLASALQAVLSEAALLAAQRESSVNRAVAVIDSLRVVAHNDSTRLACGIVMDSLAVAGIRADSIRAACLRGDRPRMGLLLKVDTLTLRDSTKLKADSLAQTRRIRRDTTFNQ